MKPFDLEAALAGAPVVTRHGDNVTQLVKFDAIRSTFILVGVVDGVIFMWDEEGRYGPNDNSHFDLFMAPVKREGWINLYNRGASYLPPYYVYQTKQEADDGAVVDRIACVRVEWEE